MTLSGETTIEPIASILLKRLRAKVLFSRTMPSCSATVTVGFADCAVVVCAVFVVGCSVFAAVVAVSLPLTVFVAVPHETMLEAMTAVSTIFPMFFSMLSCSFVGRQP